MLSNKKSGTSGNGKLRKLMAGILSLALIICPAAGLYAGAGEVAPVNPDRSGEEGDAALIMPVDAAAADGEKNNDIGEAPLFPEGGIDGITGSGEDAAFSTIAGEVTMIHEWGGSPCIRVADDGGGETDFVIGDKAVFSDADGLISIDGVVLGSKISVYFVKPLVMTMQYPPRYNASVVVVSDAGNPGTVFAGIVNAEGRASDNSVVLNVSGDAQVLRQSDGLAYAGSYARKIVLAYYAVTTRSMPPIALVNKVIVLDKMGVPVYVNGEKLYNAEAIANDDGVTLLPVRAVLEFLGYSIVWDDAECAVRIGVAIYLKIGSDEYLIGRAAPIKLEAAATLINDRTYAPLSFYQRLLNMECDDGSGLIKLTGAAVD